MAHMHLPNAGSLWVGTFRPYRATAVLRLFRPRPSCSTPSAGFAGGRLRPDTHRGRAALSRERGIRAAADRPEGKEFKLYHYRLFL
jgi:hypothetical protein